MSSESCVYLRGVDLVKLTERYLRGEFVELITPLPIDISCLKEEPTNIVTVTNNSSKMSHEFDPGCGRSFMCIGYRISEKDGRYAVLDPDLDYYCMYCLRKFSKNPMGIPIRREEQEGKIIFHMIDIFCCFDCLMAELDRRKFNSLYSQSSSYITELFTLCTGKPASELKKASDCRLVKRMNGPKSWDEFHANTIRYSEKPSNVIFLPVIEYIEQD